jgi:hypothetical protein
MRFSNAKSFNAQTRMTFTTPTPAVYLFIGAFPHSFETSCISRRFAPNAEHNNKKNLL